MRDVWNDVCRCAHFRATHDERGCHRTLSGYEDTPPWSCPCERFELRRRASAGYL